MKTRILPIMVYLLLMNSCGTGDQPAFNASLQSYCSSLPAEFNNIHESRAVMLQEAGRYIIERLEQGKEASINFVCEHNSRKSHLGQVWTQMALQYYGTDNLNTYSGGTSPTYVNRRIIKSLENAGFEISENGIAGHGPKYYLDYGRPRSGFEIYSKRYDHPANPDTNYLALTLCYNPEECCPINRGASEIMAIPYEDMQPFDNTPAEESKYDEQCRIIARDMFFMIDYIRKHIE